MQKKHTSKRRMTPFQTYLFSDIVLVVLVVLTMVPYISNTLQEVDRRTEDTIRATASSMLSDLDAMISNVESMLMTSSDEAFSALYRLGSESKKTRDYYSMRKAAEDLYTIVTANPNISDLLISYPASGITLRAGSCFDSPDIFKSYYQNEGFYEELFLTASNSRFLPSRQLTCNGWQNTEEVFGYRFHLERSGHVKACLLIRTANYLGKDFLNAIGENSYAALADNSGKLLCEVGTADTHAQTDPARFITVQTRSPGGLLTLTVRSMRMLPTAALPSLITLLLLCLLAAFTVGALYSILSARRHAMPVKRLIAELGEYHSEMQESQSRMSAMQKLMDKLEQEKEQFSLQLDEFRQTRYENALTRLFFSSSGVSDEDAACFRQIFSGLPVRYFVAYGRIEQLGDSGEYQDEMGLILRSMLREQLPSNCPICMPDARSVAVLMEENMLAERDALISSFPNIAWSFSRSYHGERFVATALEEARIIYEFKGRKYVPLTLQNFQRIYNSMIAGDDAEADLQLDELFAAAHAENIRFIYSGMRLILYLVASECGFSVIAPPYDKDLSFDDQCSVLRQAVHAQCAEINARKKSRNEDRKKRVLQYIQDNYTDSSLYAPTIAEQVGISEKYLYNFVKEQTGFSLGEYLMHLRMTKAAELLIAQDMPIKEICYAVGFNSENSFYKAFKRTYGITPTQYRAAQKGSDVGL